ncbi:hypothetical protein L9W73_04900 [Vibrio aestuarianus]|uniref:DinB family protein n=1 Tax=Vibrio aestuarianus TaxID=28171 RepID=A0A9X4FGF5_9VIBR|nr:hypothetical protein [Vibrio aestuarianus]MDE1356649.1 hypothetical protein [Vibrio aestuarianus]
MYNLKDLYDERDLKNMIDLIQECREYLLKVANEEIDFNFYPDEGVNLTNITGIIDHIRFHVDQLNIRNGMNG